jgi:hypothetical protein
MKLQALRALFNKLTGKKNPDDFIYGTDIPIVPGKLDEMAEARIMKEVDEAEEMLRKRGILDSPEYAAYSKSADKTIDNILEQYKKGTGPFKKSGLTGILNPKTDADTMKALGLGAGLVGTGAVGMYDGTQGFTEQYNPANSFMFNPEEIGRAAAKVGKSIDQALNDARQAVGDATQVPQAYFMRVQSGYQEEMNRMEEPVEILPTIEEQAIKPVSLLMAQGGPAMSDNEPRFETRSPENQMFSIDTAIGNLMTEYDMVVRNKEFERAQMIADQIDQLQQQKIGIQAQNVPQQDDISRILESISQ